VPIEPDEIVIATTQVDLEAARAIGIGALVIKRRVLAPVRLEEVEQERIVCAVADALLEELG
jgi:hypothetical protein